MNKKLSKKLTHELIADMCALEWAKKDYDNGKWQHFNPVLTKLFKEQIDLIHDELLERASTNEPEKE